MLLLLLIGLAFAGAGGGDRGLGKGCGQWRDGERRYISEWYSHTEQHRAREREIYCYTNMSLLQILCDYYTVNCF